MLRWEAVLVDGTVAERYLTETRRLVLPPDVSPRTAAATDRTPSWLPVSSPDRHNLQSTRRGSGERDSSR